MRYLFYKEYESLVNLILRGFYTGISIINYECFFCGLYRIEYGSIQSVPGKFHLQVMP